MDFGDFGFLILDLGDFGFWGFWILGILDFGFLEHYVAGLFVQSLDFGIWGFWILDFEDLGFRILEIFGLGILDWQVVTKFWMLHKKRRLCTPNRVGGFIIDVISSTLDKKLGFVAWEVITSRSDFDFRCFARTLQKKRTKRKPRLPKARKMWLGFQVDKFTPTWGKKQHPWCFLARKVGWLPGNG